MGPDDPTPEPDVLAAYVALQGQTPCRACKSTAWTPLAGARWASGGDLVGIFKVLGAPTERVAVITFTCDGCSASVERPLYSREQLATQAYPAVNLAPAAPPLRGVRLDVDPHKNGD